MQRNRYNAPLAFEAVKNLTHAQAFLYTMDLRIAFAERIKHVSSKKFDALRPPEIPFSRYIHSIELLQDEFGGQVDPIRQVAKRMSRYSTDQEILDFVMGVHYDRGSHGSLFHLSKFGTSGLSYMVNVGHKRRVRYDPVEQNNAYTDKTRVQRWKMMFSENRFDSRANSLMHACMCMIATMEPTKLYKAKGGELYSELATFDDLHWEHKNVYVRVADELNALGSQQLDLRAVAKEKIQNDLFWGKSIQQDLFVDIDELDYL